MATSSFGSIWTLTEEQAELLCKVLEDENEGYEVPQKFIDAVQSERANEKEMAKWIDSLFEDS